MTINIRRLAGTSGLALVLSLMSLPNAHADVTAIAEGCGECHGENGVSSESDVPTIAGMSAFVLEEYMFIYQDEARPCHETKYRSGDLERPATDMCQIAAELSEDDIIEIAAHFAELPFVAAEQDFDADKAALGKSVHKRACTKCHTDNASNAEDDAGIMAGQWMPYLEQVFADYVSGEREFAEKKMREKFDDLSAEDSDALIHFYGSLQ